MSTVKNVWDKISIYCMNHEEPVPMKILSNNEQIKTPFYACENYAGLNGEEPCYNRLNLDDYQGIVMKFIEEIAADPIGTDFKNFRFNYKGARQSIAVKVIKYTNAEIHLGIINKTVLGGTNEKG